MKLVVMDVDYIQCWRCSGRGCEDCDYSGYLPRDLFTCSVCNQAETCDLAWDAYNTDGDCLAEK